MGSHEVRARLGDDYLVAEEFDVKVHAAKLSTTEEAPAQGSAGALLQVNCWLRGQRHNGSITRHLPCGVTATFSQKRRLAEADFAGWKPTVWTFTVIGGCSGGTFYGAG